jgi:hypothetical protein
MNKIQNIEKKQNKTKHEIKFKKNLFEKLSSFVAFQIHLHSCIVILIKTKVANPL